MQSYSTIIGVIRLRLDGFTFPQCQTRYNIGSGTAQHIMHRYKEIHKTVDELAGMEPSAVEQLFYPPCNLQKRKIPIPDFEALFEMVLVSGRKPMITDIWDCYRYLEPDGYRRSQFYEYCNRYLLDRFGPDDLSMAVNRIPGERVYIDYCGDRPSIHIMDSSGNPFDYTEIQEIHLYVTTCGFSSKVYAEASLDEKQSRFNSATSHAIEYYGAVPKYLVPDNL